MDRRTGIIGEFDSDEALMKALKTGNWEELTRKPDKSCNKCHGRGYSGIEVKTRKYIVCPCVRKREEKHDKGG